MNQNQSDPDVFQKLANGRDSPDPDQCAAAEERAGSAAAQRIWRQRAEKENVRKRRKRCAWQRMAAGVVAMIDPSRSVSGFDPVDVCACWRTRCCRLVELYAADVDSL